MSKDTQSYKYYSSIVDLPLDRYIDVQVNGNYNALTIQGDPPISELEVAWLYIQQEYADSIQDNEYKQYLSLLQEITELNGRLQQVQINVDQIKIILVHHYNNPEDQDFISFIKAHADNLNRLIGKRFNFLDKDTVEKSLQSCINRSRSIKIQLDLKMISYEGIKDKFEKGKKPDAAYYRSILISLSNHAGYHLTDKITVYEFCERLRRLQKESSTAKK